jgi:hypothetical protein
MLMISGIIQPENVGRYVNLGSGLALIVLGAGLYQLHRRFMRNAERVRDEKAALAVDAAT